MNGSSIKILSAGVVMLLLAGFFFINAAITNRSLPDVPVSHFNGDLADPGDLSMVKSGDFILRRGNGFLSTLIVQTLNEPSGFSHAGLIVGDDTGILQVIHSVSRGLSPLDGVQTEPLESFIKKSIPHSTVVVRLRATTEERKGMLDAANKLLVESRPFDRSFQLGGDELYCSELLWLVIPERVRSQSMKYDESSGVIRFESFLDNRFYDLVLDYR